MDERPVDFELIDDGEQAAPVFVDAVVARRSLRRPAPRTMFALALVVLLAGLGYTLTTGGTTPPAPAAEPAPEERADPELVPEPRPEPDNFPGIAPDGQRPGALDLVEESAVIFIVDAGEVVSIDLTSGERSGTLLMAPAAAQPPVVVNDSLVVVADDVAWHIDVRTSLSVFQPIAPASEIRHSSKPGRLWLMTANEKTLPSDAEFLWTEVDLAGKEQRSMLRNRDLFFATPELVWGMEGDIFQFTEDPDRAWRLISQAAYPVAIGLNDLVSRECRSDFSCDRIWYDTASGEPAEPIYHDLADNISVRYGGLLSPDGRMLAIENGAGFSDIGSVATRVLIENSCLWGAHLAWADDGSLFACQTPDGLTVYRTDGAPVGLVSTNPDAVAAFWTP